MNVIQALEIGESLCASEAEAVLAREIRELQDELMAKQQHLSGAFSQVHELEKEADDLREQLSLVQTGPASWGYGPPTDPHPERPVIRLYRAPIPAPAAQVVQVPQEPIATVYIGSGHCRVAFTDAAKEAMKGKQGQSFDVYGSPMPRAVKESLTVDCEEKQVPTGWAIRREGDAIIVQHPDVGGCVVQKEPDCDRMIPEAILWALADDMLKQEAKP